MSGYIDNDDLHFAAAEGDLAKVKSLLDTGHDVNAVEETIYLTPLHYAVRGEHVEVAKYLLLAGANVNAHHDASIGETPLGEVAATCSYEIANVLVQAGADPAIEGWMQVTALQRAKERKSEEGKRVYELLLKASKS